MSRYLELEDDFDWKKELGNHLEKGRDPTSHRELDPRKFHPSYLGACKRQSFIRKLGLGHPDPMTLGIFQAGTIIHEWIEHEVVNDLPEDFVLEENFDPYSIGEGDEEIIVTGQADCVAHDKNVVYDFKSRGGWYYFNGYDKKNLDQLYAYMKGFMLQEGGDWGGGLVYINKKKVSDVKEFPKKQGRYFAFDQERFDELISKAREVKEACQDFVYKEDGEWHLDKEKLGEEGIPFKPCSLEKDECYSCADGERLVEELRDHTVKDRRELREQ